VINFWHAKGDAMQDPKHLKAKCAKCHAPKGAPCITIHGGTAQKVHYGRPYWSSVAESFRPVKIQGRDVEIEINLEEFKVIKDLRRTNACPECGEPYSQPGLVRRCKEKHESAER
jgi:hypothetical protein